MNLSYPRSFGPYAASSIFSIVRHSADEVDAVSWSTSGCSPCSASHHLLPNDSRRHQSIRLTPLYASRSDGRSEIPCHRRETDDEDAHTMNDDLTPRAHYSSLSLFEALLNASWSRNTVKKYAIRRSIPAALRVRLRAS